MKKLPTALTVPSSSFRVWLTIAPPLEAIAPALGKIMRSPPRRACAGVDDRRWRCADCRDRNSWCRCRFCSRKALTLTSCDLIVSLSTVACWAMVEPPRKTTPDNRPASTRQTIVSRSACGSLTTRPSRFGHGVERDAEQHAGEDQEQRRGEIPGEQQQRGEQRRRRCRRPISPMPDRCGPEDDRRPKLSR